MARPALPTGAGTRVFSGARAIFKFNNEVVAFAQGVSGSEEIVYEPVDVLDNLAVAEHVPTAYRVTFSAQIFRTVANGPSMDDRPGSLKQQNIFPRFLDILRLQGVDVCIQDEITGQVLHLLQQVKTASTNFSVNARSIVGQNVTFVAIRALDESEINPT
jgi:hypothetical protein